MASAHPKEVLVQAPYLGLTCIQLGWGRAEFGTHRVVAANSLFFDPVKAALVAGIDAGNPTHGHEEHQRVGEVFGALELTGDAGHVVIADESQRSKAFHEI